MEDRITSDDISDKGTASTRASENNAVAIAREYGLDISLLLQNLTETPEERLRQLDGMVNFVQEMRRV